MKTLANKFKSGGSGAHRGDAGSILVVVYLGIVVFFFLFGSLSFL